MPTVKELLCVTVKELLCVTNVMCVVRCAGHARGLKNAAEQLIGALPPAFLPTLIVLTRRIN